MEHGICDMHSHFLPAMDDGCKTAEEAVQVLQGSYEQGVRRMFATPHYYPVEPIDTFLQRRKASVETLRRALDTTEQPLPEFCLGAEVAYRPGLGHEKNLERLCLGDSRYLLLEMPFSAWSDEVVRSVRNLCNIQGFTPIIAHVERYLSMQTYDTLMRVLEQDVLVQMNAERLLRFSKRGQARKMLQSGMVQLLGTDSHNTESRKPNIGPAVEYLEKKGLSNIIKDIAALSQEIFQEAAG